MNGTFVYTGPVPGGVPMTITLKIDTANRTFDYAETGGMVNRKFNGELAFLGNQVVFTDGASKQTATNKVKETANGFKLTGVSNDNPISNGIQPLPGNNLEFFRQ